MCVGGGGGGALIFSYICRLELFLDFKTLNLFVYFILIYYEYYYFFFRGGGGGGQEKEYKSGGITKR